ncbi:hypothetical protein Closa_0704 [[Clostridium] saccharolyticum WM1]|uniref:Uncharacterized protein n=1 Tax=Lacrimispora saccharolytica (strain ATCC 35040 / DSM 2544 / NRCC 2533 / WM1) TaxID=610130 RepID=D9R5C4_LACSW|nr:hypothetical protein Closa_0704 [[Clostridium] saccharolyticum WM1]
MNEAYIHFKRKDIYAVFFRKNSLVYYNLDFLGETKRFLLM